MPRQQLLDLFVEVLELSIAISMVRPLQRLFRPPPTRRHSGRSLYGGLFAEFLDPWSSHAEIQP